MKFRYIVWHTAGHAPKGVALDTTAKEIDRWHRDGEGWRKGGYQQVIRFDGTAENDPKITRTYSEAGAHVAFLNSRAIGYCFSGHGDFQELTSAQLSTGLRITLQDMARYKIPVENVIGHREVNQIIVRDNLRGVPAVNKSCPGRLVDMDLIRFALHNRDLAVTPTAHKTRQRPRVYFATSAPSADLQRHTHPLQTALASVHLYHGKVDGWPGRMTSDAVRELIGVYLDGDPNA